MSSGNSRSSALPLSSRLPRPTVEPAPVNAPLQDAVQRASDWLLSQQHLEGFWVGELEGDTILESEYILLLTWLGRSRDPIVAECANYIRMQQLETGGWAMFPGGPLEISGSVKAYWALKIAGDDPAAEHMQRAARAIRAAGGAERVNSFTRYYLALLGIISYQQCPAVPPELILLPQWFPINVYEMSSWSRTIVVPLSLLWAFQPRTELPKSQQIDELFLAPPHQLSMTMPKADQVDALKSHSWLPWDTFFRCVDVAWKGFERLGMKPFRRRAIRLCAKWMRERFRDSDGLGAIFPPIIWSVIALRCLGAKEDSPEVQAALDELQKLTIRDAGSARLEPCRSPVWDTAIAVNALREAGVPAHHPQLQSAVNWLLSREVRSPGDWSEKAPNVEPGGWYFEFRNEFYPDIDDTIMVLMALARCLPGVDQVDLSAYLTRTDGGPSDLALVLAGHSSAPERSLLELERMRPALDAIRRGVNWVKAMQSRNGGWAAFDRDNDREILTRVPFADHNAMIDPPTADITARTLEMFGRLGLQAYDPRFERAMSFIWSEQEPDHCWYGRWGVNYIYGTWQVLVGLTEYGVPPRDARIQAAARWLRSRQQSCGGWGETARTYDEPQLRGTGPVTASQTAWALMGLMAAGDVQSATVSRGIEYLLETQTAEGTWDEPWFTGTGFPRVFYLRYHLYRHYFPLMALGRYAELTAQRR